MGAERNGGKEKQSQSTEGVFLLSILTHFLVSPFSFPSALFKHGPVQLIVSLATPLTADGV